MDFHKALAKTSLFGCKGREDDSNKCRRKTIELILEERWQFPTEQWFSHKNQPLKYKLWVYCYWHPVIPADLDDIVTTSLAFLNVNSSTMLSTIDSRIFSPICLALSTLMMLSAVIPLAMFINALFCTNGSLSLRKLMKSSVSLTSLNYLAFVTSLCWSLEHTSTDSEDDISSHIQLSCFLSYLWWQCQLLLFRLFHHHMSHPELHLFLVLGHSIHQPAKLFSRR